MNEKVFPQGFPWERVREFSNWTNQVAAVSSYECHQRAIALDLRNPVSEYSLDVSIDVVVTHLLSCPSNQEVATENYSKFMFPSSQLSHPIGAQVCDRTMLSR